jgi:hypothetical protein
MVLNQFGPIDRASLCLRILQVEPTLLGSADRASLCLRILRVEPTLLGSADRASLCLRPNDYVPPEDDDRIQSPKRWDLNKRQDGG